MANALKFYNSAKTFFKELVLAEPTANRTITFPDASGTVMLESGYPMFSAVSNVGQSITLNTNTKLNCNLEEFDLTNAYDSSTSRFTPQKAGYYCVTVSINQGGTINGIALLYKNGALIPQGIGSGYNGWPVSGATLVYLNGSTDYIELYGYFNSTFTLASNTVKFQAHYIGS